MSINIGYDYSKGLSVENATQDIPSENNIDITTKDDVIIIPIVEFAESSNPTTLNPTTLNPATLNTLSAHTHIKSNSF